VQQLRIVVCGDAAVADDQRQLWLNRTDEKKPDRLLADLELRLADRRVRVIIIDSLLMSCEHSQHDLNDAPTVQKMLTKLDALCRKNDV
jgi:archaellum biogenesis ATPase FlaH